MAETWSPPEDGTPCWINVLATDVQRAKAFYSNVFDWRFNRTTTADGRTLDPTEIAMFEVPGQPCPGGGITRVSESEWAASHGKGGVVLYLYVDDINSYEKKIVEAGGKRMTEIMPEGDMAVMQHFEDTEGNYLGIYSMKK
ncbi:Glyoxalase/bleomycin resistance protein/dioxygenase [Cladophialophora carrionii]|uniref:Glyoxalase/bleomycin resistance protein/dioxygenase n=1 Tax=Cladophialophora carrionii TaxID=86049 RepID=A0A1C1CFJ1_9EURO|nr:Glyoxalase/bleomycin resistance protein/dioxygenase [Cladophialophora carrionii]